MCNRHAPREILFFAQTILRCRKKSLFFDARASGAEKSHCFLTLELPAQKKVAVF